MIAFASCWYLLRPLQKVCGKLSMVSSPNLVATFENDRLGLTANVRELPETKEFEVAIVDAFTGDVVVSRNYNNKQVALEIAENLIDVPGVPVS